MGDTVQGILALALAGAFIAMIAWQWRSRDFVDPVLSIIGEDETFRPIMLCVTTAVFSAFAVLSAVIGIQVLM
jgi:hypothetical protein